MQEIWKDVKGYEGFYQVSNLGNVKSLTRENVYYNPYAGRDCVRTFRERILKQKKNRGGYIVVHLRDASSDLESWPTVHRLVSEAFIPNPENKPTINHKDGVKTNNLLDNLEWNTWSENTKHAYDNGLAKPPDAIKYALKGEDSPHSKLTVAQVLEIRRLRQDGLTLVKIASMFGIYFSTVDKICKREAWKHV